MGETLRTAARAATVLVGLGLSSAASAYVLLGYDWSWQSNPSTEPILINNTSFPGTSTADAVTLDVLRAGMNRWGNDGGAKFAFTDGGTTTRTSYAWDNYTIVRYTSSYASGGTLASTQSWGYGSRTEECDVLFYAGNDYGANNWSTDANGASWSELDVEQVMTHEMGHCAGLDHSASTNAVMYYAYRGGSPTYRALTTDDKNGLQAIYGKSGSTPVVPPLELTVNGSAVAGQPVSFTIDGADPGEMIYLLASTAGTGSGPCPQAIGGQCMGIKLPLLVAGKKEANAFGFVNLTVTIPAKYAGLDMGFQAAVQRGANNSQSLLSNAVLVSL